MSVHTGDLKEPIKIVFVQICLCVSGGGNCGDLDDIINDLCALEAELADAQKECHVKQPLTDGDSGNVDDLYSPNSQSVNWFL